MRLLPFLFVTATVSAAQAPPQIPAVCERLLPAALVGQTAGQPKAALIPRQPKIAAGGDCNYVVDPSAARPRMMLLADINTAASHQDVAMYAGQTAMKPIAGLGDEAFGNATIVVARRGKLVVVVSAFSAIDMHTLKGTPYFTQAQLIELVRQALAKG